MSRLSGQCRASKIGTNGPIELSLRNKLMQTLREGILKTVHFPATLYMNLTYRTLIVRRAPFLRRQV